ncbi:MAG: mechanosensitive ion channel family protein [Bdellovibrionota bacterium]
MQWFDDTNTLLRSSNYLGVNLFDWGVILLLTALLWSGLKFLKKRFGRKISGMAARTSAHWDDIIARCIDKTHGVFLLIISLYASASIVGAEGRAIELLYKFFVVAVFFQAALWGNEILGYGLSRYLSRRYGQTENTNFDALSTYSVINITAKFVLWTVLFLLLLDNLGVNITALVTGLGIGGIAIALAVQNILGDIFASLTIVMDKPFEVGDYIVVGDKSGTVEAVGLKTSRVRALSGEQLIFPNKMLVESEIQNFKRMQQRRVEFGFKVDYESPVEAIEKIPGVVAEIVQAQENIKFDRSHLARLGDTALEFTAVYTVLSTEYNAYMDIQQKINFAVIRALSELGASFSYPTPSVIIQNAQVAQGSKMFTKGVDRIVPDAAH